MTLTQLFLCIEPDENNDFAFCFIVSAGCQIGAANFNQALRLVRLLRLMR